MNADDLAPMLASTPAADTSLPDFGWHQGEVLAWNSSNNTNKIRVAGSDLNNLPVLTSAGSVSLEPGTIVGILRFRSVLFVLGRVVSPGSALVQPQTPIQLFPQFISNGAVGTIGQARVNAGVLATWEGRVRPNSPYIEVDGVWGNVSGAGSTTYQLKLGGTKVGEWISTTLDVNRKGPFDVRSYIGQDWLKIELAIVASTGTGEKAIQPLGVYFRQG
jgi:hypothetical protein